MGRGSAPRRSTTRRTPADALVTDPTVLAMRLVGHGAAPRRPRSVSPGRRALLSDPVLDWLACGAVLMATARGHDFIFPSLHNDWLTTGDMLRLVRGVGDPLRPAARGARAVAPPRRRRPREERRALAAELHDGLAQELAYVTMQTALAELEPERRQAHRTRARGRRARARPRRGCASRSTRHDATPFRSTACIAAARPRRRERGSGATSCSTSSEIASTPRTAHELGRVACEALHERGAPRRRRSTSSSSSTARGRAPAAHDQGRRLRASSISRGGAGPHELRAHARCASGPSGSAATARSSRRRPDGTSVAIEVPQALTDAAPRPWSSPTITSRCARPSRRCSSAAGSRSSARPATCRGAIALAERRQPAVCILDINMPGGGGIEAARDDRGDRARDRRSSC